MNKEKMTEGIRGFLIWFSVFYLLFWGFSLWQNKNKVETTPQNVELKVADTTPIKGHLINFIIKNNTEKPLNWTSLCENKESLKISGVWANKTLELDIPDCDIKDIPSVKIASKSSYSLTLNVINNEIFKDLGEYQAEISLQDSEDNTQTAQSPKFKLQEPGMFRKLFRALVSKPLFNLLVYLIDVLPGHSLGWSIILLTIIVRIILFLPNQKAMASQRQLQKLQPKIQEMRKKYGKNQQQMALKTMELYKTHKISPMSSCLPMLLQMPFLLGIYYIVSGGLSPHLKYLLYSFNQHVDLSVVQTWFMGLNLEVPNIYVLPFLVAGAQFLAIYLSMARIKKQNKGKKKVKKEKAEGMAGQMEDMQKMMMYVMPIMIGVFTATFPAAVGVYWLTSTVFGIGQQFLVNWQLDKPQVVRKV